MKILILSIDGDGLGIAFKLAEEKNEVKMYIKEAQYKQAGVGIIDRISSWRPHVVWADLVICDMVGFGKYEQTLRQMGKVVFSCSNLSTAKTYVCKDKDIYKWALTTLPKDTDLIVQKIVTGVEVSTEGWFNGRDWISPFNHTFEEKRFLEGDKGSNTGCMGNIVVTTTGDKLTAATVVKFAPFLKRIGYRGPIDINTIIDDDRIYALEITFRLGYDAIEALMEGLKESVTDLFFETAIGVKKEMAITDDYMIAVRLSVPPWPHGEPDNESVGMPIIGINEFNLKHLYLTDAYRDERENYLYAGGDGAILKVTARGRDIQEARNRVYRTIDNLTIQDVQYRSDIGLRAIKDIKQLKDWGWLNG